MKKSSAQLDRDRLDPFNDQWRHFPRCCWVRSKDLSELATAYVADDGRKNYLTSVNIKDPKYKRLGIGTALYNAIEKHRGRELEPSPTHQSHEAKAFWSRRTCRTSR